MPIHVIYLTNGIYCGAGNRTLLGWLKYGSRNHSLAGGVVVKGYGPFTNELEKMNIPFICSKFYMPHKIWPWPYLVSIIKIYQMIHKVKSDIIHCNGLDTYIAGRFVARYLKIPIICNIRFKTDRKSLLWSFHKPYKPNRLLFDTKDHLKRHTKPLIGIIEQTNLIELPNLVDLQFFPLGEQVDKLRSKWNVGPDQMLLSMACTYGKRKRIEDFLYLIAKLKKRNMAVVGLIAGRPKSDEPDYIEKIYTLQKELGLERDVRFIGYIKNDIQEFYQASDLSISCSEFETFGMSIAEAMACGCPVLAYKVPGLCEVIGDSGVQVPFGDIEAMETAAVEILTNPLKKKSLRLMGHKKIEQCYSGEKISERLLEIYEGVIKKNNKNGGQI